MFCSKTFKGKSCYMASDSPVVSNEIYKGARIEDVRQLSIHDINADFSEFTGNPSVLFNDETLSMLCDNDHLPVIARNHLNNGESKNLWYEQVVPRFSRLYFAIAVPEGDSRFSEFNEVLDGSLVQIGGNASVGNGVCKISKIEF